MRRYNFVTLHAGDGVQAIEAQKGISCKVISLAMVGPIQPHFLPLQA